MSKAQVEANFHSNAQRSGKACFSLFSKWYLHALVRKRTAQTAIAPFLQGLRVMPAPFGRGQSLRCKKSQIVKSTHLCRDIVRRIDDKLPIRVALGMFNRLTEEEVHDVSSC